MKRGDDTPSPMAQVIGLMLKPVIRFSIRKGFLFQEFSKIARSAFVEVAEEEILKTQSKVNVSRISVLTGLYRNDVANIYTHKTPLPTAPQNVLGKVIVQWEQDKRFRHKETGEPKVLTFEGDNSEFFQLVRKVSKHLNPATVLFEIQRNRAADRTPKGLKLVRRTVAYGNMELKGYELLSKDLDDLISAVSYNLERKDEIGYLHLRTDYDNVCRKDIPEIRKWLILQGKAFHKRVRDYLSQYDKDLNPDLSESKEPSARVSLGSFSFSADIEEWMRLE